MGSSRSHRNCLFALVLSALCVGSHASAQIGGGGSPEVRTIRTDLGIDGPYREVAPRPEVEPQAEDGTVSADILRHPISEKARKMLRKASETMQAGSHQAAIEQLLDVLSKYPESAAFAHSLLGVEYMRTEQFRAAADSLERAAAMLPHDAVNRYNFGLSLVCSGDYERGEREVRRALQMDPNNRTMKAFFGVLLQLKGSSD